MCLVTPARFKRTIIAIKTPTMMTVLVLYRPCLLPRNDFISLKEPRPEIMASARPRIRRPKAELGISGRKNRTRPESRILIKPRIMVRNLNGVRKEKNAVTYLHLLVSRDLTVRKIKMAVMLR